MAQAQENGGTWGYTAMQALGMTAAAAGVALAGVAIANYNGANLGGGPALNPDATGFDKFAQNAQQLFTGSAQLPPSLLTAGGLVLAGSGIAASSAEGRKEALDAMGDEVGKPNDYQAYAKAGAIRGLIKAQRLMMTPPEELQAMEQGAIPRQPERG